MADHPPAESLTLVIRVDADLLDVGRAVHQRDEDETGRVIVGVDRHPEAAGLTGLLEELERWRRVLGDVRHPDAAEEHAGGGLQGAQELQLVLARGTDGHRTRQP